MAEIDSVPERHASYSSLALHRVCPQRFTYRHLRRLERVEPGAVEAERDLGNWWHALRAAHSVERGLTHQSLQWTPERLSTGQSGPVLAMPALDSMLEDARNGQIDPWCARVMEAAEGWWLGLSRDEQDAWAERMGGSLPERLRYLDARWREQWAEDLPHLHPLAVEMRWERTLPAPADHVRLVGYVDEVYRDVRRDMIVVGDHKTHRALDTRTAADDMLDSQLQIYAWGASPIVSTWGLGKIRALSYDRVRSVAPKQPSITASGALSKSVTDYDLATYLAFAAGPDGQGVPWGEEDTYFKSGPRKGLPKFGHYVAEESVITNLSDPAERARWFQRTMTPLNRNLIRTHLRSAVDSALDVDRTRERFEEEGDAARNFARHCQWCDFADLCRAEMTGGAGGEYDLESMFLRVRDKKA